MFNQVQQGTQSTASLENSRATANAFSSSSSSSSLSSSSAALEATTRAYAALLMNEMNSLQRQDEQAGLLDKVCKQYEALAVKFSGLNAKFEELTAGFWQLAQSTQMMADALTHLNKRIAILEQNQLASLSSSSMLSSSSSRTVSSNPGDAFLQASTTPSTSTHTLAEGNSQSVSSIRVLPSSQLSSLPALHISSLITPRNNGLNSSLFFGSENLSPPMRFASTATQTTGANLMFPPNCFSNENGGPTSSATSL